MSRKLTKKQLGFIKDVVKTGNLTQSALKNYDTKDYMTAAAIGSENLNKPQIKKALLPALKRYEQELGAILDAMELKDKNKEKYETLTRAMDIVQKQVQLLSGKATDNIAIDTFNNEQIARIARRISNGHPSSEE